MYCAVHVLYTVYMYTHQHDAKSLLAEIACLLRFRLLDTNGTLMYMMYVMLLLVLQLCDGPRPAFQRGFDGSNCM